MPHSITTTTQINRWIDLYVEAEAPRRRRRGLESYEKTLRHFARHVGDAPLSPDLVADYLASRPPCSSTTIAYECCVLAAFGRFLARRGLLQVDLLAAVDRPTKRRSVPRRASRSDIDRVADWVARGPGQERDRRFVALCLYGGLRISEAAALDWRVVDLVAGELVVVEGKGGADRVVPIAPPLGRLLGLVPERVRVGAVAGQADGRPLTPKAAAHIFDRVLVRELGVKVSAHQLRRAFATTLDERGVSLRVIQELLGHTSLATTERYIGVDRRRKRDAVDGLDGAFGTGPVGG